MRPVPKQPSLRKLPTDDRNLSRDRAKQPALMGPRVGAGSCLNGNVEAVSATQETPASSSDFRKIFIREDGRKARLQKSRVEVGPAHRRASGEWVCSASACRPAGAHPQ